MYRTQKYIVRRWLLDEQKRVDGRQMDQMRPLAAEIDLLPRVHGCLLYTSLKRFKDDVKEVADGYDFGMTLEKFNDVKEGDVLEAFTMEEYKED